MKKSKPGKRSCHLVNKSVEWLRDGCWFYPWKRITRMVIGVLAKVVILTLATLLQWVFRCIVSCCCAFSQITSFFHFRVNGWPPGEQWSKSSYCTFQQQQQIKEMVGNQWPHSNLNWSTTVIKSAQKIFLDEYKWRF